MTLTTPRRFQGDTKSSTLRASKRRTQWEQYLLEFHSLNPGITEELLSHSLNAVGTPYQWVEQALSGPGPVLDVGCGSAPMLRDRIGVDRFGLDLSREELTKAMDLGLRAGVIASSSALPFAASSFSSGVCSMALMVMAPLPTVLAEINRVLVPGAPFVILVPCAWPLGLSDVWAYLRIYAALWTPGNRIATRVRHLGFPLALKHAGFEVKSDDRLRFNFSIRGSDEKVLFLKSLYLPTVGDPELNSALATLHDTHEIGIPLRRIVALKR